VTVLQIIALIAQLVGAAKDVTGVMADIHSLNLKPEDTVPPEHVQRIQAALAQIQNPLGDPNGPE
jgi:hypothetical protein